MANQWQYMFAFNVNTTNFPKKGKCFWPHLSIIFAFCCSCLHPGMVIVLIPLCGLFYRILGPVGVLKLYPLKNLRSRWDSSETWKGQNIHVHVGQYTCMYTNQHFPYFLSLWYLLINVIIPCVLKCTDLELKRQCSQNCMDTECNQIKLFFILSH